MLEQWHPAMAGWAERVLCLAWASRRQVVMSKSACERALATAISYPTFGSVCGPIRVEVLGHEPPGQFLEEAKAPLFTLEWCGHRSIQQSLRLFFLKVLVGLKPSEMND